MRTITTILLTAVTLTLPSTSQAWQFYEKWPTTTVRFTLNASDFPEGSDLNRAARDAMKFWSNVPGSSFKFEAVTAECDPYKTTDGVNCVSIEPDLNWGNHGGGVAHAHVATFARDTDFLFDFADVHFNAKHNWSAVFNPLPLDRAEGNGSDPVSLLPFARHEFGHALGLCHEYRKDRVGVMSGAKYQDGLHADDKAALRSLYPGSGQEIDIAPLFIKNTGGEADDCGEDEGQRDSENIRMPPAVVRGDKFEMEFAIENRGNLATGNFNIAFFLSTNPTISMSDTLLGTYFNSYLGPHQYGLAIQKLTIPANTTPGKYFFGICVDSDSTVTESVESNNCTFVGSFSCLGHSELLGKGGPNDCSVPVIVPDFTMTNLAVTSTTTVLPGKTLTVTTTTVNQGDAYPLIKSQFAVGFFLSTDRTCQFPDPLVGGSPQNFLFSTGTVKYETTLTIPSGTAPGSYTLCANADFYSIITESNETNNSISIPITVHPNGIDLAMSTLTVPRTVRTATSFTVANAVRNRGQKNSPAFTLAFYLSKDAVCTTSDWFLGSRRISSLAPGAVNGAYTTLFANPPEVLGSYIFCAISDSGSEVVEDIENNNTYGSLLDITW